MLRLTRFRYERPRSLDHALELLDRYGEDGALMAGGTDLLVNIKQRVATPAVVIPTMRLPEMHNFEHGGTGWLTIGAGTTLRRLETDQLVQNTYPALAHAAHLVSVPQIRTVATLGGNVCLDVRCNYYNQSFEWRKAIGFCMKKDSPVCRVAPGGDRCWAVSSADTVPVLIALGAEATIVSLSGVRRVPVESLYRDDGLEPLHLQRGDIISALHLPPPGARTCVYEKFRIRQSFDFPLVGAAVSLRLDGAGAVEEAFIVLTAVNSMPERVPVAEQALVGAPLDERVIQSAGDAVFRQAKPMDNTAGSIFHRKRMARVLVQRALRRLGGLEVPAGISA